MKINLKNKELGRKEAFKRCKKYLEKNPKCLTMEDMYTGADIAKSTWYALFPVSERENIPEWCELDDLLETNRIEVKSVIRDRLLECNNPTALIALYRLIGTQDDKDALNPRMDMYKSNKPGEAGEDVKLEID